MPEAAAVPAQSLHGVFLGSRAVAEGVVTRRQLQSGLYRRLLHNVYAIRPCPPITSSTPGLPRC